MRGPRRLGGSLRIFLSFHSKDLPIAEEVRAGLGRLDPGAQVFFSPVSLGAGFWVPKLAAAIAEAEAFILLVGPAGIGPWQEVEYFSAVDRHVNDKRFALVPVIASRNSTACAFFKRHALRVNSR